MSAPLFMGVDVGGTHTRAWIVDDHGNILGKGRSGGGNYQSAGTEVAGRHIRHAVEEAVAHAKIRNPGKLSVGYGVAGADRPQDFEVVRALLPPVGTQPPSLVNDSELVLHAGAPAGVGVGLVAGTGTNAIGRAADGRVEHVGGMGWELGDFGSAGDLGREAVRRAMRGHDGRGEPTGLYDAICSHWNLEELLDLVDMWLEQDPGWERAGELAPLVFEQAARGDNVARDMLRRAGQEMALSAAVLMERLFGKDEQVTVVLGGSVLQQRRDSTLNDEIVDSLARTGKDARVVVLEAEPIVGAVLLAAKENANDRVLRQVRAGLERATGGKIVRELNRATTA